MRKSRKSFGHSGNQSQAKSVRKSNMSASSYVNRRKYGVGAGKDIIDDSDEEPTSQIEKEIL